MIIKFRVLLDTEEDVFRDIAIEDDMTFMDFHACILDAFEWDNSQMASFYESNENWDKGQEIPLMDIAEEFGPDKKKTMGETLLSEVIKEKGQKMVYVYDFMLMWCFYVDVISIEEPEENMAYPMLLLSLGDSPNPADKEPVDFTGPGEEPNDDETGFNFDDLIEN